MTCLAGAGGDATADDRAAAPVPNVATKVRRSIWFDIKQTISPRGAIGYTICKACRTNCLARKNPMCRKLVLLVCSAGPLFAAAAFRQTAPPTLAGVVRDEPNAVVHHVTAAARTFSRDQCRPPANANPGSDVINNPASELSPRTDVECGHGDAIHAKLEAAGAPFPTLYLSRSRSTQ
jgi:hypothetical protein